MCSEGKSRFGGSIRFQGCGARLYQACSKRAILSLISECLVKRGSESAPKVHPGAVVPYDF